MVKYVERKLTPDDPTFKGGAQVFTPIARPRPLAQGKSTEQLIEELKAVGAVKRGTVERLMLEQLERGGPPKSGK